MIVNAILSWVASQLHGLVGMLPSIPTQSDSGLTAAAAHVWAYAAWANYYVPLDSAMLLLGLIIAAWWIFYGFRLAEWVLTKLHILGGSS
jgi:hypothetical protein